MTHECDTCKQTFDTEKGLNVHKGKTDHKPFHRGDYLRREYIDKRRGGKNIAREWGVDPSIIYEYLDRHGIERRGMGDAYSLAKSRNPCPFYTGEDGYEFWQDRTGRKADKVYHHRLLAVAKYGFDAVGGMHVHHESNIPWDNRPENIELHTPSDHTKLHAGTL